MENNKISINKDSQFCLLEELYNKCRNGEAITDEEFIYCINGFYIDFKEKIDEMACGVSAYKITIPTKINDFEYSDYDKLKFKVNVLEKFINDINKVILKSIEMILESPKSENIRFLLSQKELFDDYFNIFLNDLEAFCYDEESEKFINRFYKVKDKMLEKQDVLKDN